MSRRRVMILDLARHRQWLWMGLVLVLVLAGWRPLAWTAPAVTSVPSQAALQRAVIDALATGKDVQPHLDALALQSVPTVRHPLVPKRRVAGDLKSQLVAFRDALGLTLKAPLSASSISALEQAYQRVQATHLLMVSHFEQVQDKLQNAAAPKSFESRRLGAFRQYHDRLETLLDPLATPFAEWREASDRAAHLAAPVVRRALREALNETFTLLELHGLETEWPILRAQTLPVRPASLASRERRAEPAVQPSYTQPSPPEPEPADLAGTPDAPLNEAILQQAQALEYDAVRIYEFVRNEIETQDYAGAMKGAVGTLRQRSGNAVDQASLLIALLRASSLPARYVHGVIRLPMAPLMARLGMTAQTDADPHVRSLRATMALSAAGIAYRPVIEGGRLTAVELASTWVSAYVPYTNYRGTLVDATGPIWVPLMPSIQDTAVQPSGRILAQMQSSVPALITDYLSQPQSDDLRTHIETMVEAFLQADEPASTYAQQLGARSPIPLRLGLLPAALPAEVVAVTGEAPELDDSHRQRLRFVARAGDEAHAPIILDHTVPVAEVASERLTLSYLPATAEDQRVANLYGGIDHVPAYLIKLRPQLKRNDRLLAVAQGTLETGVPYRFDIHLLGPAGHERVSQNLMAGSYHAIGVTAQANVSAPVDSDDTGGRAFLAAALLNRVAVAYSQQWTRAEDEFAGLLDVALVRPWPHVVMVNNAIEVDTIAGQPHQLHWRGVTLDAGLRLSTPIARTQARTSEHEWLALSALQGSLLEHRLFEQRFLVDSISADKGLQLARAQGVPVHRVDAQTLPAILPRLSHPQTVLDAIAAWVGIGFTVEIPATPIAYQDWQGSTWRVLNPATGATGYFIAGGLAGGATSLRPTAWALSLLRDVLASPNTAAPNTDPLSAAFIHKVPATDGQIGDAGSSLPKMLGAYVRDHWGRPVQGATVTFHVTAGGACLGGCVDTLTVLTDAQGIASASLTLGALTSVNPADVRLAPQDRHPTRVGVNWIEASVEGGSGRRLSIPSPFTALAKPNPIAQLMFTSDNGNRGVPAGEAYLVGLYRGSFDVAAVDAHGNPVANVNLVVAASEQPLIPNRYCDHIPTHILGETHRADCSVDPPMAFECGGRVDTGTTDFRGVFSFHILVGDGSDEDLLKVSAPDHPHVPPLQYRYPVLACQWPSTSLYHLDMKEPTDTQGRFVNAALAGQRAAYPLSVQVYKHFYSRIAPEDGTYYLEWGEDGRRWQRTEHPKPLWVTVEGCVHASGCATPNPMRHVGNGRYETYLQTHPSPGRHGGTIRFYYLDRHVVSNNLLTSDDEDVLFGLVNRGWKHRDLPFAGVTGLRLQTTVTSRGVPKDQPPHAIYLDGANRSRYPVDLTYTIEPADYHALHVAVHLLKDGVLQAIVPGSSRSGQEQARLPRGFEFDPEQVYTAQLILNHGSRVPVQAEPIPLPIVPGKPKLLTDATDVLQVLQEVDVVNQRSCLRSSALTFTLSEDARVSLVFKEVHDQTRTHVAIDAQAFAKGQHRLPFYVPALQALAPEQKSYALHPGKYVFALTAVSTDPHDPTDDAIVGRALVSYRINALPVGRTLDRGVDVANGNLSLSTTDLEVPGRGAHLKFQRSYSANRTGVPGPLVCLQALILGLTLQREPHFTR